MESRFYREKRVKMYRVQTICHTVDPIKTKPGVILNSKGFYVLSEQNRTEVVFNILRGPCFKQTFHSGRILKMAICKTTIIIQRNFYLPWEQFFFQNSSKSTTAVFRYIANEKFLANNDDKINQCITN